MIGGWAQEIAVAPRRFDTPFDGMVPIEQNALLTGARDVTGLSVTNGTGYKWSYIAGPIKGEIGVLVLGSELTTSNGESPLTGELTIHNCVAELTTAAGANKSTRIPYPVGTGSEKVPTGAWALLKGQLPEAYTKQTGGFGIRIGLAQTSASGNLHGHPNNNFSSAYGEVWVSADVTKATSTSFSTVTPTDSYAVNQGCATGILLGYPMTTMHRVCLLGDSHAAGPYSWSDSPLQHGWFGNAMYSQANTYYARIGTPGLKVSDEDPHGDGTFARMTYRAQFLKSFNTVVIMFGHNDINGGASGATAFAKVTQLRDYLYTLGVGRVLICTLGPYGVTSTDFYITTANQTAGDATVQSRRVAFNALVRALGTGNYIDLSDAVSNGGGDGTIFKAPAAKVADITEANGGSTTRMYPTTANIIYQRRTNHVLKVTSSSNIAVGQIRHVIKTWKSGSYDGYEVNTAFVNGSAVATAPAIGTVAEVWAPYTVDGTHLAKGSETDIAAAFRAAGL